MNTLFDKIWDKHVVQTIADGPTQLYIDRLYCHEVTSPQAFAGLRQRGIKCLRPQQIVCMPDHNTPTHDQDKEIADPVSRAQVDTLERNAKDFGLTYYGMMNPNNGIIHVVGPETGLTLPGMTIVCGAHVYSRRNGRCGFRNRHKRGGNGDGFAMHPAITPEDNAHHRRRQARQGCDG